MPSLRDKTLDYLYRLYRRARIRKYKKFQRGHVFDVNVYGTGFKMSFLDLPMDLYIVERIEGRREPETTAMLKSVIRPGSTVVELGSCYGYFTNIIAEAVGPGGRVLAIEGYRPFYEVLVENLELNSRTNVIPRFVMLGNDGDTVRLSSILSEEKLKPDFIFMDIEGCEIDIFEDMEEFQGFDSHPIIGFEMHPQFYTEGRGLDWIESCLKRHGYRWSTIGTNYLCQPK